MTPQCKRIAGAATEKYMIAPKTEKGYIQIVKDEYQTPKFQWKNRITDQVNAGVDLTIFPGDASFKRVNTGRPDDRVLILQFAQRQDRRFFFWLQDKVRFGPLRQPKDVSL